MITYAERRCFREAHMDLFRRVEAYVARISDRWGNELRCHELARAVQRVVDDGRVEIVVVDGKCGPIEHSWLVVDVAAVVIDPYAPGRLPAVQIVDPMVAVALYRPGDRRVDIDDRIVRRLVAEMCGRHPAA